MPLVLTLHKARAPADQQRESRTLEQGRLTIGRGPGNGWVLQDPAQHLSKTHCVVSATAAGFSLTDCSSNGVFLNGSKKRMERDAVVPVADGDEFVIGDYLVRVTEVASLTSRAVAAGAAAAPRGAAPAIDRDDPFGLDEFLAAPAPAPPPPAAPPRAAARQADPFADPRQSERHDPFGEDDGLAPHAPAAARPFGEPAAPRTGPGAHDPFNLREPSKDPFGGDGDDMFRGRTPPATWQGPSQPDNVDGAAQAFVPPKTVPMPSLDDWDDLLGDEPPPGMAPATPPPLAAHAPAMAMAAPAPPAAPQAAAPPQAQPAAAAPAAGADAGRLLAAFLDGAGVPRLDVSDQDPAAYFHDLGALFAMMVESLRDVLMSRATVKGEFGVEQTMLRSRDNNALKFSVTPADAVGALLQPGRPGYMPPMRAAKEAFDDIRIHQLAVMAGVQAALFNLLRTFDPAALEGRLQKGSMIESILPGARRAKLWEAFCAAYKEIARDADSDFQAVFGREFARAYAEQAGTKR